MNKLLTTNKNLVLVSDTLETAKRTYGLLAMMCPVITPHEDFGERLAGLRMSTVIWPHHIVLPAAVRIAIQKVASNGGKIVRINI